MGGGLFQDMQGPDATRKEGYIEIKYSCDQAIRDDLEYVWWILVISTTRVVLNF